MKTTRSSLLVRLKNSDDTDAWSEFYELYGPIIYNYATTRGLNHHDATEVQSACYESVVKKMPIFEYEKSKGGFKAWLRTVVSRRVVDFLRKRKEVSAESHEIANIESSEEPADVTWDQQWKHQHLTHCFRLAKAESSGVQYEAFRLLVEEDKSVAIVSEMTGLNANQIYKAKARVLGIVRNLMLEIDAS